VKKCSEKNSDLFHSGVPVMCSVHGRSHAACDAEREARRERVATAAMKGSLANPATMRDLAKLSPDQANRTLVRSSIGYADALIAELDATSS